MNRGGYSLDEMKPVLDGELPLPNFERDDKLHLLVSNLAAIGHNLMPRWGYAQIDGARRWAFYFLTPAGMSSARDGSLDGGGYVLIYGSYPNYGFAGTFAICKHEKQSAPGANPSRGWHPGACSKCGLDMTIDSGD